MNLTPNYRAFIPATRRFAEESHVATYRARGQRCAVRGCRTVLSIYNPLRVCALHTKPGTQPVTICVKDRKATKPLPKEARCSHPGHVGERVMTVAQFYIKPRKSGGMHPSTWCRECDRKANLARYHARKLRF